MIRIRAFVAAAQPLVLLAALACSQEPPAEQAGAAPDPSAAPRAGAESADDEAEPGFWRWSRRRAEAHGEGPSAEARARLEELQSLGYVAGAEAPPESLGVLRHEPGKVWPGLNLVVGGQGQEAYLEDLDGRVVHRWSARLQDHSTHFDAIRENPNRGYWRSARLLPDGGLLAIWEGIAMARLDRESRVLWLYEEGAHHAAVALPDGRIWVLTRQVDEVPEIAEGVPIFEDFATLLDPGGRELRRISIVRGLLRGGQEELLKTVRTQLEEGASAETITTGADPLHTNAIQVVGEVEPRHPAFQPGRLLLSAANLNALLLLDPESGAVVWSHVGTFRSQHDPRLLPNGRILLFDNWGGDRQHSRVMEIDPADGSVLWSWAGEPGQPFFSWCCGTARRLPNGNTLIVETQFGRALEIDRDGSVVWEYVHPHLTGEDGEYIAQLFVLERVPLEGLEWLGPRG